jgi:CHAT domain-containing protein
LNLAFVLLKQRRLIDAEYYARKSLQLSLDSFGRGSTDVGRALLMLARIINEQGRPKEAVLLAEAAQRSALEGGATNDSIVMAQSRRALGTALVVDGQFTKADQVFQEMLAGIQSDPDLAKNFVSEDLDWVMAMLKINKYQQAEQMTKSLLVKTERASGKTSPRLAIVRAFEASALQGLGKSAEANTLYKQSIPILVDQSRNDAENDTSSIRQEQRLKFLFENYISALAETAKSSPALMPSAAAEAFTIADIARGSGVQRALTASAARANIKDPQLANLARKEQDLQRRINTLSELLTGLLSAAPDQQLPGVQTKIRSDISIFKAEREAIKKEIEKKFPDYAELVEPKPATIERTQKLLRVDEVLVSYYFADQVGYIWAISKQGPVQFVQIPLGRSQMSKQVSSLRKALDPGVSTIDEIPAFDVASAYRLYQQLLEPVSESLKGKKVMLVVPHAELGQLPLSVLITKPITQPSKTGIPFSGYKNLPWLAKEIGIAQIPSVTALTALRNLPEGNRNRRNFVGFGDPYFSASQQKSAEKTIKAMQLATRGTPLKLRNVPKMSGVSSAELALLPRLPDTSEEIQDIAKVMSASPDDIFLHQKASVKQVMSMDLSNRKVVMFATHGLVPGELNGLTQPALAMSSPEVTGDSDDGLLTMDQVLTLKLDADWVVLSACNTAAGDGAGSEAVSGLGRAFFFAGAKALLVSNWPVDSAASRSLMTDLFKRQQAKGIAKAEALKESMVAQIEQGGFTEGKVMKYSYAHPLFWAPFVIVGD